MTTEYAYLPSDITVNNALTLLNSKFTVHATSAFLKTKPVFIHSKKSIPYEERYNNLGRALWEKGNAATRKVSFEGQDVLPHVHTVASLLKRWLLGTLQGSVSRKQIAYYLDEFTFRFNRRTSEYRGQLFSRIAGQTMHTEPYHNI